MMEKLHTHAGLVFPTLVTVGAVMLSRWLDPYLAFVATSWIIFGLLGLSLDVIWGRGGLLSLAQTAFYGLGGYFGAVIAINLAPSTGITLVWALPAAAAFGAFVATALGYIIFYSRMGALQSTILSYTFTLLLWSVTQTFKLDVGTARIGGDNGLSNIPGIILGFGADAKKLAPNDAFVVVVIISAAVYFFTRWLMRSNFGKIIDCIRIDIEKAELLGYDIRRFQVLNFAYSGAIAGLAGALFALWANYLNPSIFSVQEALLVPIYVLVGGLGTLAGPFLGALIIGGLSFWLGGGVAGGQTTLILGVVLILLVLFLHNGFLGAIDQLWRRFLPDANDAARNAGTVKIDTDVLEDILREAAEHAGPAKSLATKKALKRFGGVIPVNKVSRSFKPGEPHALIGPNGAGKSSFLKTCVGLYRPESGAILLNGDDITGADIFDRVQEGMGVKNKKPQVFGE
ncbi:MAG: ATP-binding cassette domain-containing protein, partial [Pseudomonadota bacterium]